VVFGEFTLDVDQRRLLEGDRDIRLTPKAFELLHLLIAHSPRALSKDEIIGHIWPDTFVSESSLSTLVGDLRAALHDCAQQPRFIRTVYSYGYAFGGEIRSSPSRQATRGQWRLIDGHREIALPPGETIIGRSGPGILTFDVPGVSRRHARLIAEGERMTLQDLASKNGTWVGSTIATTAVRVSDGNEIRLGPLVLVARLSPPSSPTETIAPAGTRSSDAFPPGQRSPSGSR
jgi:DNA-binding winged helix-turn-helix (wHTH) protein